ncbi:MAG: hypothetical protein EOP54_33045 [Sphingobacteriales bacterium]|nr:MAG: hypothetical protein EOP54_33045 [Sphingobacteriales bacterium]
MAACAAIAVSSCKKDIPAQIAQPAQPLKTVTADCTMFQWAKQIHSTGIKSVQAVAVDPTYGFTYIAGTINNHATVDLDPGPGEYIVTGWSGFIVRLSAAGNFSWALPVEDTVVGFDMATATANSLYIAYQLSTGKLVTSKIDQATLCTND